MINNKFLLTQGKCPKIKGNNTTKQGITFTQVGRYVDGSTEKDILQWVVVLLHTCFSVVGPIRFLLAAIFSTSYIGMTQKKNGGQ